MRSSQPLCRHLGAPGRTSIPCSLSSDGLLGTQLRRLHSGPFQLSSGFQYTGVAATCPEIISQALSELYVPLLALCWRPKRGARHKAKGSVFMACYLDPFRGYLARWQAFLESIQQIGVNLPGVSYWRCCCELLSRHSLRGKASETHSVEEVVH